jgi:hypothetical protein
MFRRAAKQFWGGMSFFQIRQLIILYEMSYALTGIREKIILASWSRVLLQKLIVAKLRLLSSGMWYLSTKLNCVIFQKTVNFIVTHRRKDLKFSLPCSQESITGRIILSQMNPVHNFTLYSSYLFPRSLVHISHLSHAWQKCNSSHPLSYHSNSRYGILTVKLLIMCEFSVLL